MVQMRFVDDDVLEHHGYDGQRIVGTDFLFLGGVEEINNHQQPVGFARSVFTRLALLFRYDGRTKGRSAYEMSLERHRTCGDYLLVPKAYR